MEYYRIFSEADERENKKFNELGRINFYVLYFIDFSIMGIRTSLLKLF